MSDLEIPRLNTGKPDISMAPLIDVVFLLLIFFMVTTVFPDQGIVIEKPESQQRSRLPDNHLILKLDQQGRIYFKNTSVTIDDVQRLLETEVNLNPGVSVVIKADKRSTTGILIQLIDAAKSSGARLLGIATDDKPAQ
ncbi:MAG: ExbD/TolR family protein [Gammaproteobacteria bacterium]